MKIKLVIASVLGAALVAVLALQFGTSRHSDPIVRNAISKLQKQQQDTHAAASQTSSHAHQSHTFAVASDKVMADAIAVSSFFLQSELAGLSNEQLAQLEVVLASARRTTYELLVERGKVTKMPNGDIRIEIPAQGDMLAEMRNHVHESVASIVGKDTMRSLKYSLGQKFDAKFAYFGTFDTTIDLSFDRRSDPDSAPAYVTMRNDYSGRIRSTHVLRIDRFESDFISLATLGPKS